MALEFPLQFTRQYSGPLDISSVMTSAEKTSYLSNPVRYAGQVIYDSDAQKLFVLNSAMTEWLEVGSDSTGVGSLRTDLNSLTGRVEDLESFQTHIEGLTGSGSLTEGQIPVVGADGKLSTAILPALAITDTYVVSSLQAKVNFSIQDNNIEKGDVLVVNDEDNAGADSNSYIWDGTQWVQLRTPLDSAIDALSSALQDKIDSIQESGVDALTASIHSLTGTNSIATLGTIASQDYSSVNITGGAISVSALTVTQGTALFANVSTSGSVTIGNGLIVDSGAATLASTLGVSGAATLGSTLDVAQAATLAGTLGVSGAATLGSTLDVAQAATLASTLGVSGAATLGSTLNVGGAVTMSNTLSVTGPVTIVGNLSGAAVYNLSGYNCYFDAGSY